MPRWTLAAPAGQARIYSSTHPILQGPGPAPHNFAAIPTDPIPYTPALPQFVTYMNGLGVPTATLCINLTPQMTGGLIGDMLQFRTQDDTAVDFITMTLN